MEEIKLNPHNKQEYPPMHSAEHILNGEMARRFNCGRAFKAHVERKKSKLDYHLPMPLSPEQIEELNAFVNAVIDADVEVFEEFISQEEAKSRFDLRRLPDDASDMVRVVHIGEYDECLCTGAHVKHTAEIGRFYISSASYNDGVQRLVFRLSENNS